MNERADWAKWDAAQESGLKLLREAAPSSAWPWDVRLPVHWWKHVVAFATAVESAGCALDVIQIKEKFGGLRLYWGFRLHEQFRPEEGLAAIGDRVRALVGAAEAKCEATCLDCGEAGAFYSSVDFSAVLCKACGEERESDRASRIADLVGDVVAP